MMIEYRATMRLRHVWVELRKTADSPRDLHLAVEQWHEEGSQMRGNEQGFLWVPAYPPSRGEWRIIDMPALGGGE